MIDTPSKRRSSLAKRRLPWLRRFTLPIPDATVDQGDRQHLVGVYSGVLAGEAVPEVTYSRLTGRLSIAPTLSATLHFTPSLSGEISP